MRRSKTIIYYTSNREDPVFEEKIVANLKKQAGNIPIISVSQKPMNLGKNICVGDVGQSYFNEFRQIAIGAKAAKTPYVVFAESDFLYPRDYFTFEPQGDSACYRYDNIWIVYKNPRLYSYRRKTSSLGAQICKRDFVISRIEDHYKGFPEWTTKTVVPKYKSGVVKRDVFLIRYKKFGTAIPCISFKTDSGLRSFTNTMRGKENISSKLPYWGHVADLRKNYL